MFGKTFHYALALFHCVSNFIKNELFNMNENKLIELSMNLAIDIVNLCKEIKHEKRETVLTNQLLRSGTSIGANIREANYAHGKADFIAKLQIAVK